MTRIGVLQRRRWASGPDQMLADMRFVGLYCDLDVPDTSALSAALATITAAGPQTRLALTPATGKRLWRYGSTGVPPVHRLPDDVVSAGSEAIMEHIRNGPDERQPLEVHVSQRHIAFDIDHGLGGGHLTIELMSAIAALCRGDASRWVATEDTPLALPRALFHTFLLHPTRAVQAWRYATETRAARAARPVPPSAGESVPWSPSPAVVLARIDAESEAAVNEWRRINAEHAGSAAIWLYIVRQALREAGLAMTDGVMVAFDCRRYLPRGVTANSNFIIGLDIELADDDCLPTLIRRLAECKAAAAPLAAIGVASARAVLQPERRPPIPADRRSDSPANVMYTDLGLLKTVDELPWSAGGERSLTGLLDPAGPEDLTVLNSRIDGARNIAITFHDNVLERDAVQTAGKHLRDPVRFLVGGRDENGLTAHRHKQSVPKLA